MIRLVGGPLDGKQYDLIGEAGERIDLNSAAGVCVYEFAISPEGETGLNYVGRAGTSRVEDATEGSEF